MLPQGPEVAQIGILARKAWQAPPTPELGGEVPPENHFLFFADQEGIGSSLSERLRAPLFVVELSSVEPRSQAKIPLPARPPPKRPIA